MSISSILSLVPEMKYFCPIYSPVFFPPDLIDVSRYGPVFNSHLQVCVDRTILPVASDTVDFMFSKKLPVYHTLLMTLLHKLGKQNLWRRARELFRREYCWLLAANAGIIWTLNPFIRVTGVDKKILFHFKVFRLRETKEQL